MISPVWVEFSGINGDEKLYVSAVAAGAVEETPQGSRIRVDGEWVYVAEEMGVVMDRLIRAGEFSTEAALYMAKGILDALVDKNTDTVH